MLQWKGSITLQYKPNSCTVKGSPSIKIMFYIIFLSEMINYYRYSKRFCKNQKPNNTYYIMTTSNETLSILKHD